MCLLIATENTAEIPTAHIKTAMNNNPDGGGIVHTSPEGLKAFHTFKAKELQKYIKALPEGTKAVIHMRYSTHGTRTLDNVHPFKVRDDLFFAHNGILDYSDPEHLRSDTRVFNDEILKILPPKFEENTAIMSLIAEHIGNYNKLAFLRADGEIVIVNEEAGHWTDQTWYSNYSYQGYTKDKGGKALTTFADDEWDDEFTSAEWTPKSHNPRETKEWAIKAPINFWSNMEKNERTAYDKIIKDLGLNAENFLDGVYDFEFRQAEAMVYMGAYRANFEPDYDSFTELLWDICPPPTSMRV